MAWPTILREQVIQPSFPRLRHLIPAQPPINQRDPTIQMSLRNVKASRVTSSIVLDNSTPRRNAHIKMMKSHQLSNFNARKNFSDLFKMNILGPQTLTFLLRLKWELKNLHFCQEPQDRSWLPRHWFAQNLASLCLLSSLASCWGPFHSQMQLSLEAPIVAVEMERSQAGLRALGTQN